MNDITSNMVSYLFITVFMVIFSTFGLSDNIWNNRADSLDTISFDYDKNFKLSEDGKVALHELKKANSFSINRIGFAGSFTKEYNNFAIIMNEQNAISALKELSQNKNKFAQAYGLIGLEIKKPNIIKNYKNSLLKSKKTIEISSGCFLYNKKTTSLLSIEKVKNYDWLIESLEKRYHWLKSNNKLFNPI